MLRTFAQRLAVTAAALALFGVSCAPKAGSNAPNAQSPERQAEAEYDLARDRFGKNEPRQALDHALKAVELDPDNAKALYFTSNIYLYFCSLDLGFKSPDCRLEEAEKFARLTIKADSSFRDAKNTLGQILILENKYAEAISVLEPLAKDPSYAASHLAWGNLGWAQVQAGQVDAGILSLRNAVTQPKFCVGFYRLGVAYEKKGDLGQAEQNLSSALSIQTENGECERLQAAYEARGRVRQALGKTAEARTDFNRCKELSTTTLEGKQCLRALSQLGVGGAKSPPLP